MNDLDQDTPTEPQTFNSTVEGLQEAAHELASDREREPVDAEPVNAADDVPDQVDAGGNNRGLTLKDAAEALTKHRAELDAEREAFERAVYGDQPAEGEASESAAAPAEPAQPAATREAEPDLAESLNEGIKNYKVFSAQVEALGRHLSADYEAKFPDIKTPADVERVAREDPQRWAQFESYRQEAAQVLNQVAAASQQYQAAQQQTFNAWANAEDARFYESNPELKDSHVREKLFSAAIETLTESGYEPDHIKYLWNNDPSFRSAANQKILLAAARYHMAKKASKTPAKPVPPVQQRPGTAGSSFGYAETAIREASERMDRSPTPRNAARLLVAERRARPTRRGV